MHQQLYGVAAELWGVDINADGIAFLEERGFKNLVLGDIGSLDYLQVLKDRDFDVIVASEVVEHLQNPGMFFHAVKTLMVPGETDLIVTVPNAYRVDTLLWLLRGVEYVHPDHNYWFSYQTAMNLFCKNGLQVEELYVYVLGQHHLVPARVRHLFRRRQLASSFDVEPSNTVHSPPSGSRTLTQKLRSLPRRLVASLLYRITPFWGDGLIFVARLPTHD